MVLLVSPNTLSPTVIKPICVLIRSIFTEIYLPKSKPFIVRPPDKINYVNCIDQIFSQIITLEIQEHYLFGDLNRNLLFKGEEVFINKIAKTLYHF